MGKQCEYCGNLLTDEEKICPSCGGPAPVPTAGIPAQGKASGAEGPKTIAELQAFARKHNLPLKKMRVFIGEDCKQPKAFGIFQESENSFVVYKNKADGSRAIRYRGPDEARAVGELYGKMRDMVKQQKAFQTSTGKARSSGSKGESRGGILGWFSGLPKIAKWAIVILIVVFLYATLFGKAKRRGYYNYNGDYYYQQNGSWYVYQDYDWVPSEIDDELSENFSDYYYGGGYDSSYGIGDFSQSDYYDEPAYHDYGGSDNDWSRDDDDSWDWDDDDDDWDWGGGDWDDISDWDSDW